MVLPHVHGEERGERETARGCEDAVLLGDLLVLEGNRHLDGTARHAVLLMPLDKQAERIDQPASLLASIGMSGRDEPGETDGSDDGVDGGEHD